MNDDFDNSRPTVDETTRLSTDSVVLRADIDRLTNTVNNLRDTVNDLRDQLAANASADDKHREHTRTVLARFFPFDEPEAERLIPPGAPVVVPADVASAAGMSEDRIVDKLFARFEARAGRH